VDKSLIDKSKSKSKRMIGSVLMITGVLGALFMASLPTRGQDDEAAPA
jgi:hypothetical protein